MVVQLVIRDDSDVCRIIDALLETADTLDVLGQSGNEEAANEGRARTILANRLGDELDTWDRRQRARAARAGRTISP